MRPLAFELYQDEAATTTSWFRRRFGHPQGNLFVIEGKAQLK